MENINSSNTNPYSRPPINFERLKSEQARLETFKSNPSWPVNYIRPEDCALTGFFFLQDGDKVQCAFCRGVAGEWENGDIPAVEHRRHFPRCPFVCNLPVGNIPIGQEGTSEEEVGDEDSEHELEQPTMNGNGGGIDVCGPFDAFSFAAGSLDFQMPQIRGARPLSGNMAEVANDLAIKTCNGPSHMNFVTAYSRLKTFTNWPANQSQKPEEMSDAGFFYIGTRDYVKCFYCDGGLRNWEENDDPWIEHARWFPNCTYVQLNKGDDFIKQVKVKKPATLTKGFVKNHSNNGLIVPEPRRVSDEELRCLIDTPIVKAALDMGMEVNKVKAALRRKLQQTGQTFLTTESLLEAILGRDSEYDSDSEYEEIDDDENEDNLESLQNNSRSPSIPINIPTSTPNNFIFPNTNQPNPLTPLPLPFTQQNQNQPQQEKSSPSSDSSCGSSDSTTSSTSSSSQTSTSSSQPSTTTTYSSQSSTTSSSGSESSNESSNEDNKTAAIQETNRLKVSISKSPAKKTYSGDSGVASLGNTSNESGSDDEIGNKDENIKRKTSIGGIKEDLHEEVRRLREARQCKICMDNEVGVVFLPCGHLVSCIKCATAFSHCALCREPIKAVVRTYLS